MGDTLVHAGRTINKNTIAPAGVLTLGPNANRVGIIITQQHGAEGWFTLGEGSFDAVNNNGFIFSNVAGDASDLRLSIFDIGEVIQKTINLKNNGAGNVSLIEVFDPCLCRDFLTQGYLAWLPQRT